MAVPVNCPTCWLPVRQGATSNCPLCRARLPKDQGEPPVGDPETRPTRRRREYDDEPRRSEPPSLAVVFGIAVLAVVVLGCAGLALFGMAVAVVKG